MLQSEATSVSAPARTYSYSAGASEQAQTRAVAVEAPVNLVFGGVPYAVMMATPADLEDFAFGFCLTEGIVDALDDIRSVSLERAEDGLILNIALASEKLHAHLSRTRAMAGRTGCGLCGIDDLAHLPKLRANAAPAPALNPAALKRALDALHALQPLNEATRAVHAAAWCDASGAVLALREDVGRHNALDKTIGAMFRARQKPDDGFFIITSRCSFEMVAKAAAFGARTLIALSAPTSLALQRAAACGVALIAVARADGALLFGDSLASSSAEAAA